MMRLDEGPRCSSRSPCSPRPRGLRRVRVGTVGGRHPGHEEFDGTRPRLHCQAGL